MRPLLLLLSPLLLSACGGDDAPTVSTSAPLIGEYLDRATFINPYAHIPAQCHIETAGGAQNACLYCHSNGPFKRGLGNNTPQAGYEPIVGDLQQEYAFAALSYPLLPNGSQMPWENTLFPEKLRARLEAQGIDPTQWDMAAYLAEDNWMPAYQQRPGSPLDWDSGVDHAFRLFPGLDPQDLPANEDGFVRSAKSGNGYFADSQGFITGWRAVNFMPYGIFTPHSGSVSGIYLRLPQRFMRRASGEYDLELYRANLDLLARAIQDRLQDNDPAFYLGAAADTPVQRGLYPLGTEFAHPLHYVDVTADGIRAKRVKEIRYMYKYQPFAPDAVPPGNKDEAAPVYAHRAQGWIDNGAGWRLAGYIEDRAGALRPQTPSELVQCVGCHSGTVYQESKPKAVFTSGTGNTIDSTWALPRQWQTHGWAEMDYLGYRATPNAGPNDLPGRAERGDPTNRGHGQGEFRFFLDHVLGASLYGDMPDSMEVFFSTVIRREYGDEADWPALDTRDAEALSASQRLRQRLIRALTARNGHLDARGMIQSALLYPPRADSLAAAARYRQVVVTQTYDLGKDVFPHTLVNFRYYRRLADVFSHQDGRPYALGEAITDRPIDLEPASFTYGVGISATLIDENLPFEQGGTYYPDYLPLLE